MKRFSLLFLVMSLITSCENDEPITSIEAPSVVAEFRTNLSELNLYVDNLSDLQTNPKVLPYNLNTPLFTDYAHKQRLIALPENTKMEFNGDGLPIFPDNTVIAKTFYYNLDERDPSLGQQIIETRVLIKINGNWESGDYVWNEDLSEATLDPDGRIVPISWIDENGTEQTINYEVPSNTDCFTCHSSYNNMTPIGPKLRSLNFERNGVNQLQEIIDLNLLDGLSNSDTITSLPNWEDASVSLEERARAYMDINCAHCHIPGGFCEDQSTLNLDFSTPLSESNIINRKQSINFRISEFNDGFSMPFIGTTILHDEGISLIQEYLDSL
ncbi:hypothetical protein [Winogradskyella alexanderae]|uniref:Repeat protein (TIGR03806 family) n=1 Tax=Winogradskyella alexanderae TaxID=2877123 RepID=A0ABS7XTB1_9FLAO|nr:hypothetical protein [Winogradskyella alexanderae]MCA0133258.1 hypothetical protein [Winogradskyella alexanderae]